MVRNGPFASAEILDRHPSPRVPPHPTLCSRYTTPDKKPEFVKRIFDNGAKYYDPVVAWGFLHGGTSYRRRTLVEHGLVPGQHLLDVGCGTGLVAVEAAKILGSTANITCLDPSAGMLEIAKNKLRARFVIGRAEQMPLPDNSFDFLTMGYALRHVTDLEATFQEFRRVLKPGGRLLILEVTKPVSLIPRMLFRLWFGRVLPFLTLLFTRSHGAKAMMQYYWETMDASVPPDTLLRALKASGFAGIRRHVVLGLFSEYTAEKA